VLAHDTHIEQLAHETLSVNAGVESVADPVDQTSFGNQRFPYRSGIPALGDVKTMF